MFANVTLSLMGGFVTTVQLFCLTLVFALPLGLLISFGSMSRITPLRALIKIIVWIVRGTPLMLQIIIIYYGPALVWGLKLPRFSAALLSFVINYACYFSEIFRGGIQGIPSGQYEAGQVLGMTKSQIFFKVTLLQVIKRVIPPMGNEFINLVKYRSGAYHRGIRGAVDGRKVHQERRYHLAAVLHRRILPAVQRYSDPAVRLDRKENGLL